MGSGPGGRRTSHGRVATAGLALVLAAACGTTVPMAQRQQAGALDPSSGLSGSAPEVPRASGPAGAAGSLPGIPSSSSASPRQPGPQFAQPGQQPGQPVVSAGPQGVVPNGSPLKVGILYINNDAAASVGVSSGNTFSLKKSFEGLVAAWNKRGGLAGRRIVPTYVELRSSTTNLAADLQAACTTFTQDAKVAVVLSVTGTFSDAFAKCMSSTPVVTGDYALGDQTSMASAPMYFAPDALTTDRRALSVLHHYVDRTDKVGVLVEGCPYNLRTYQNTVVPEAKRLGVTIKDHFETKCFQSANDLGSQSSDMQAAVLRFGSEGVTKVMFVSGSGEGNLVLFFLTAAQSQSYSPHYAFSSAAGPVLQEGQSSTSRKQLANAVALGWLPALDTSDITRSPEMSRCVADVKDGAGVTPAAPLDRLYVASTCDVFAAYETALRLTRGSSDPAGIRDALHRMSFRSAADQEGAVSLSGRQDGAARARTVSWDTPCGCFRYTGASFGI